MRRVWQCAFSDCGARGREGVLGGISLLGGAFALVMLLSISDTAWAAKDIPGVKRALLIGINAYQELPKLRGALHDIETLNAILTSRYGFRSENVRLLSDEQATRRGILEALEQLARESGSNDVVFIHYSGHGSQVPDENGDEADDDGMDETLCPQDARTENVPDITDDELDRIISRMEVRWLVMSMDSCHSGTVLRDADLLVQPRFVAPDERRELYAVTARSVVPLPMTEKYVLFTGAASHEPALDGPFAEGRYHGLFSYGFTRALASAPPGATARGIMRAVEQEFENVRPKLGGRRLPDPQLEGPREFLDRSLIPSAAAPAAAKPTASPRLAYAELRSESPGSIRLLDGLLLGAMPGSLWAIYPERETRFAPGGARARAVVQRIAGADAIAKLLESGLAHPLRGRAVLVSSPPASHEKARVRLRKLPKSLRARIRNDLVRMFGDAVELVGAGERVDFIVDCEEKGGASGTCSIFDAAVENTLAKVSDRTSKLAGGVADVISRSIVARSLLSLSNRAAGMELQLGIVGRPAREMPIRGMRGVVVNADLSPHRLRFYQQGSTRTHGNSLQLTVRSNRDCYLTLLSVDSEGKLQQIFPNRFQSPGFHPRGLLTASAAATVPDTLADGGMAGFHFDYGPPAGTDTIRSFCMTQLADAELLRERVRGSSSGIGTRAADAVAARSTLSELARELSRGVTRGLVVVPDAAAQASFAAPERPPAAADWAAASVTLEISP